MARNHAVLSVLFLGSIAGCSSGDSDGSGDVSASSDALSQTTVLTCKSLTFSSGAKGGGQSVRALDTRQLSGTQDNWDDYVEFSDGSNAICDLQLPAGVSPASLTLRTNYRGSAVSDVRWVFEALDATTGQWVLLGDNAFASDWRWSATTMAFPGAASRFVSSSRGVRVRYRAATGGDASDLDELVVLATTATGSGGAGGTDAGTGGGSAADAGKGTGGDAGSGARDAGTPPPPPPPSGSIWHPKPGTTWQWQLTGALDTSFAVQMYDIDLFTNSAAAIASIKAKGAKVICYLDAGSWEPGRPDSGSFTAAVKGSVLDGWPDEMWLDIRSPLVRTLIAARMDVAVSKGCDGVEPDNVDGYQNATGFPLTAADQLSYNEFLATSAHARNLSVALKNDTDQVAQLVSYFDFELDEECFKYSECSSLQPFIAAGKAVFEVEYGGNTSSICSQANSMNFDTLIKDLDLTAKRTACR